MTFKTLEARYNEKVNDLYAGATSKFENGRPSRGFNDDPLMPRRPGNGYFGFPDKFLGRALPTLSAIQDTLRMVKYTASFRGLVGFLAKQQLLQSGNTFQTTRLINPAFHILAAGLPGIGNILRVRRHWSPRGTPQGLLPTGKTDAYNVNVKALGQLQEDTYQRVLARYHKATGGPKPTIGQRIKNFLGPVTNLFGLGGRPNIGWTTGSAFLSLGSKHNPSDTPTWGTSRPELAPGSRVQLNQLALSPSFAIDKNPYLKYKPLRNWVIAPGSQFGSLALGPGEFTAQDKMIPNQTDPANTTKLSHTEAKNRNVRFPYDSLANDSAFQDYINVSFAMGKNDHIRFRAFIKDIQQSASPQYKEYQYIGRTEKFISYTGVQREVSFKLAVLALSRPELENVWKRINYLTGLVFPYGISNGIYQPNIVRMSIGTLFVNQPMYVTSLSTNFSEVIDSWDIENEIPMGAQIDIKCVLIEKTQKVAHSPFYAINEILFNEEYDERKSATNEIPVSAAPEIKGITEQFVNNFFAGTEFGNLFNNPAPARAPDADKPPATQGVNNAGGNASGNPANGASAGAAASTGNTSATGVTGDGTAVAGSTGQASRSNANKVLTRTQLIMFFQSANKIKVDGIVGPETRPYVRRFQRDASNTDANGNKLVVDGIVGPRTTEALQKWWNAQQQATDAAIAAASDDINRQIENNANKVSSKESQAQTVHATSGGTVTGAAEVPPHEVQREICGEDATCYQG